MTSRIHPSPIAAEGECVLTKAGAIAERPQPLVRRQATFAWRRPSPSSTRRT